jgi:hypothetical protein
MHLERRKGVFFSTSPQCGSRLNLIAEQTAAQRRESQRVATIAARSRIVFEEVITNVDQFARLLATDHLLGDSQKLMRLGQSIFKRTIENRDVGGDFLEPRVRKSSSAEILK